MNEKSKQMIHLIAGVYLIYLGVNLVTGVVEERPGNMVFMIVAGVLFVVIGAAFSVLSIKRMRMKEEDSAEDPADESDIEEK